MKWGMLMVLLCLFASCEYTETTKETGHKGKARINPYLAAERFLESYGYEIERRPGWPRLEDDMMMVVVPVESLTSQGYVKDLDEWVRYGGHAVVLMAWGDSHINDWSTRWGAGSAEIPEVFSEWMAEVDMSFEYELEADDDSSGEDKTTAERLRYDGGRFEVFMEAKTQALDDKGKPRMLVSKDYGEGIITLMADARPFRNRYIGDYDHAALLLAVTESSMYGNTVVFVRNASLSFWDLLWERLWPAMVALILLIVFWLWKSLPRFGPLDSFEEVSSLRAYGHHLEALGDFHWRLDRAEGLLRPLRQNLLERAHGLALSSGNREQDVFLLMAERAGMSRERVERAMTFERAKDAGSFTRLVADLQTIHLSMS